MPRYLLETRALPDDERSRVLEVTSARFPEVALEQRYRVRGQNGARDVWVCRAGTETQMHRWAEELDVAVDDIRRIEEASTERNNAITHKETN